MKRITTSTKIPHIKSADIYVKIAAILLWVQFIWFIVSNIVSAVWLEFNLSISTLISTLFFGITLGIFAFFVSRKKKDVAFIVGTGIFSLWRTIPWGTISALINTLTLSSFSAEEYYSNEEYSYYADLLDWGYYEYIEEMEERMAGNLTSSIVSDCLDLIMFGLLFVAVLVNCSPKFQRIASRINHFWFIPIVYVVYSLFVSIESFVFNIIDGYALGAVMSIVNPVLSIFLPCGLLWLWFQKTLTQNALTEIVAPTVFDMKEMEQRRRESPAIIGGAEQLQLYSQLHFSGAITDDEFCNIKTRILSEQGGMRNE